MKDMSRDRSTHSCSTLSGSESIFIVNPRVAPGVNVVLALQAYVFMYANCLLIKRGARGELNNKQGISNGEGYELLKKLPSPGAKKNRPHKDLMKKSKLSINMTKEELPLGCHIFTAVFSRSFCFVGS